MSGVIQGAVPFNHLLTFSGSIAREIKLSLVCKILLFLTLTDYSLLCIGSIYPFFERNSQAQFRDSQDALQAAVADAVFREPLRHRPWHRGRFWPLSVQALLPALMCVLALTFFVRRYTDDIDLIFFLCVR
jgi:hypothetical protein